MNPQAKSGRSTLERKKVLYFLFQSRCIQADNLIIPFHYSTMKGPNSIILAARWEEATFEKTDSFEKHGQLFFSEVIKIGKIF